LGISICRHLARKLACDPASYNTGHIGSGTGIVPIKKVSRYRNA
jgi:hypothetical protein